MYKMTVLSVNVFKQLFMCGVVSMPMLMSGTFLGWTSPVMQYIIKGELPVHLNSVQGSWVVTLIDIGNMLLAFPASILMDRFGRKITTFLSLPIALTGWLLILNAHQAWHLYLARVLHGTSMAISFIVSPTYVGEIASISIRGSMVLLVDLAYAFGLLEAYVIGWVTDYYTLALIGAMIPLIIGILLILIPESPYYLMMMNKPEEAARSLRKLRNYDNIEFEKELEIIRESATKEKCQGQLTTLLNRDRVPLIIVLTLAVMQITSGVSAMESYASSALSIDGIMSPNASAITFGFILIAACVLCAIVVDKYGRRPLIIASCFGTAVGHTFIAVLLSVKNTYLVSWLMLACEFGTVLFINIGLIPIYYIVQCEYFPSDTRGIATSAGFFTATCTSAVVMKLYQPVCDAYGKHVNFIGYAVLTFFGGLFGYFCVFETKGKSFQQIQADFKSYAWFKNRTVNLQTTNEVDT